MLERFLGREARRETLGIFIPTIIKKKKKYHKIQRKTCFENNSSMNTCNCVKKPLFDIKTPQRKNHPLGWGLFIQVFAQSFIQISQDIEPIELPATSQNYINQKEKYLRTWRLMGIQYKLIVETSLSLYVRQAQTTGVNTERQGLANLIRVQTVFLDYLK